MIDVDNFKHVNDTFGHLIGDEVLKWLCIIMQSSLRQTDCLGRLGGEEFGIILTETNGEGAVYLAERIRKAVERKKFCQGDVALTLTVSIGLTNVLLEDTGIDILRRADKGLLSAKESGKNKVVCA
jgi:diguanylate cyclase (GGDEF)-like protein